MIYVCKVKGTERDTKKTTECESGSGKRRHGCMDEAWVPDGGKKSIESDRDKWSVRDREKGIQTYAC